MSLVGAEYTTRALLLAELDLRRQQGAELRAWARLWDEVERWDGHGAGDAFWERAAALHTREAWPYAEPSAWQEIARQVEKGPALAGAAVGDDAWLHDRLLGGLAGRFAGCMLGKPLEIPWPPAQIRAYLELADAYPLRDYVPLLTPFPEGFDRPGWHTWAETTQGNLSRVVRDDDVDYTLAGWQILRRHGTVFTPADVGAFWLETLPYHQVYTAERCAYRSLVNGLAPPETATYRNPYREWIGAQIRADAYGYLCPGQPGRAARLAWADAALSHTGNGIYGAMWVAAMIASAFVVDDARAVVEAGLAHIPPHSRLAEAIGDVLRWHETEASWERALEQIRSRYGAAYDADSGLNWVHVIPNACLVALGLLYGEGDYGRSICIAVMGGWDTDCNGATAGSVVGVMRGRRALPDAWIEPLNDRIETMLPGLDGLRITELATDFVRLVGETATRAAEW